MPFAVVTGVEELDRQLAALSRTAATRVSREAVNAALRHLTREAKARAPRGKTGNLIKGIKQRAVKVKGHGVVGAAVVNASRHAHLVTLGTKERRRVRIGGKYRLLFTGPAEDRRNKRTGRMRGNRFFYFAVQEGGATAAGILKERLQTGIDKEAARLAKRNGGPA